MRLKADADQGVPLPGLQGAMLGPGPVEMIERIGITGIEGDPQIPHQSGVVPLGRVIAGVFGSRCAKDGCGHQVEMALREPGFNALEEGVRVGGVVPRRQAKNGRTNAGVCIPPQSLELGPVLVAGQTMGDGRNPLPDHDLRVGGRPLDQGHDGSMKRVDGAERPDDIGEGRVVLLEGGLGENRNHRFADDLHGGESSLPYTLVQRAIIPVSQLGGQVAKQPRLVRSGRFDAVPQGRKLDEGDEAIHQVSPGRKRLLDLLDRPVRQVP